MRVNDKKLNRLTKSDVPLLRSLAKECRQARERGIMPTIDLASQLTSSRTPIDMKDGVYLAIREEGLSVCAWTPEEGGKGKTTQVHLTFDVANLMPGLRVVHRMRSGPGVDMLIRLLAQYRDEVWPNYDGVQVGS